MAFGWLKRVLRLGRAAPAGEAKRVPHAIIGCVNGIFEKGKKPGGQVFAVPLPDDAHSFNIGRAHPEGKDDNHFYVPSHTSDVSRKQWTFEKRTREDGGVEYFLTDRGSHAGTRVDGVQKIWPRAGGKLQLKHGQVASGFAGFVHLVLDEDGSLVKKLSDPEEFFKYVESFGQAAEE